MSYTLSQHHGWLDNLHDRDLAEQAKFEDRAEAAGAALLAKLEKLEAMPQHQRDAAYIELIRAIFTGSRYGRSCLHTMLEKIAQDAAREPSELLIRWHFGSGR